MFSQESIIGVVGSGAMGSGIAQVSATNNYKTIVFDTNADSLIKAKKSIREFSKTR